MRSAQPLANVALDDFVPAPRLREEDHVDVGASPDHAWAAARHLDFGRSHLIRALFFIRTLADTAHPLDAEVPALRIDDLTAHRPGFQILAEREGTSVTVGAIGKVWQPAIEFADVTPATYAAFAEPGFIKVAWEVRCEPRGSDVSRIVLELRVSATDEDAWQRFKRYFSLIGPFSHFIRRHALSMLVDELGGPGKAEQQQPLAGDDLVRDAIGQVTHGVTIHARPDAIWPWLAQMGCRRAGWYSWDALDNAGVPSARHIVPEWQDVRIGDILPATPKGTDGFEVLRVDPPHTLVLGSLFDLDAQHQLPFGAQRPAHYYQGTWAFVLEPIDPATTRLHVRVRAAFGPGGLPGTQRLMLLMHNFMQSAQLRHLRDRVERRSNEDGSDG